MVELHYKITIDLRFFLGFTFGFVISGNTREQSIGTDKNRIFNRLLIIRLGTFFCYLWLRLRFFNRFR